MQSSGYMRIHVEGDPDVGVPAEESCDPLVRKTRRGFFWLHSATGVSELRIVRPTRRRPQGVTPHGDDGIGPSGRRLAVRIPEFNMHWAYHWLMTNVPTDFGWGGRQLWDGVTERHELDQMQLVMLEQACRQRDRCDALAPIASTGALRHERDAAMAMSRLLTALRLPDQAGRIPQSRQPRGVQAPSSPPSALERGRQRHTGSI